MGDEQAMRGLTPREHWMIWGSLGFAVLLLSAALLVPILTGWSSTIKPDWWVWLEAVLINIGAAIALVAPIEWFGSQLRHRVEASEVRQGRMVREVRQENAARIDALSARVDGLSEIKARVDEQIAESVAGDRDTFGAITKIDANGQTALDALRLANRRHLISDRGIRVPFDDDHTFHLLFNVPQPHQTKIRVVIKGAPGTKVGVFNWPLAMTAEAMVVSVARMVRDTGSNAHPDVDVILKTFAETLIHADKYEQARPILQFFSPQWAVTEHAVVGLRREGGESYVVAHDRRDRLAMEQQVRGKGWLDESSFDEAWLAADELYPPTQEQKEWASRATRFGDDPSP